MKCSLSPLEIHWALPLGFPWGSGYISSYIPPLVTIQLQYIILKYVIWKLNSTILPSNVAYISQYTPKGIVNYINEGIISLMIHKSMNDILPI